MKYKEFGLADSKDLLQAAMAGGYAVPAFNFSNMEQLQAILIAAANARSPAIIQVSESALKYMGDEILMNMVRGAIKEYGAKDVALHLDHGHSFEISKHAIDIGFSSVMIDASDKSFEENIEISRQVVEYAHSVGSVVEAELGGLAGIEDGAPESETHYTKPEQVIEFVERTGIDSLAISIGTSHGAYKFKHESDSLRFDILADIEAIVPALPLVLHGASSVPQEIVDQINEYGGEISGARGIPIDQLHKAANMNISKINVDSDARLAFTAAVRKYLAENPKNFDPRRYLTAARDAMTGLYEKEIKEIMGSDGKRDS
jgi:fructose-bisphosphate aldolase class II